MGKARGYEGKKGCDSFIKCITLVVEKEAMGEM
jgi:hypothetical protein